MALKPAGHPIWATVNIAVIGIFVLIFSYINASNFDGTELKMIVELLFAWGGFEYVKNKLRNDGKE